MRPLSHLLCVRGFESSLSIPLLGYRSRAPRRHLPPQIRMPTPRRRRRGFSPGYPCRDADARPNPTQAPAGLLQRVQSLAPDRRFQFSPLPSIPGDRTAACLRASPPLSRPSRQSRVSWKLRATATTGGCLPRVVFGRFRAFFPSGVQNLLVRAHDPRVRISCFDQDLCSVDASKY